jgi:hypothetical protein
MIADERRLLELIAAAEEGCTEALLLGHGFALRTPVVTLRLRAST